MLEVLLPLFGFFIGILASMTGIGGGIIIVPLLTLVYSLTPANAVGTSLAAIILTAIASTINYSKLKQIYYKTGLLLALVTAPGAIVGAYLTTIIPTNVLAISFGFFLVIIALKIIKESYFDKTKNKVQDFLRRENKSFTIRVDRLFLGAGLSFFAGITSGLLGVGGGIILVPLMIFVLGLDIHVAVATSMLTMIFTSISGVGQHFFLGNINLGYALLLGAGSVVGTYIGVHISKEFSSKTLKGVFAIILLAVSTQMILRFL